MYFKNMEKPEKQIQIDHRLYDLTTLVAGNFSLQEALSKLAEAAVSTTNTKACSIRLLDAEAGELKMRSTFGLSEEYRNRGVVSVNDGVIKAAFAGQAVVIDEMGTDDRVKHRAAAVKEGLVSQLTVALRFKDKPIGVLRLYSPKPKRFDEDDITLARLVASQCAVAITNARLYSKAIEATLMSEQMRLAGVIQRRMIPEKAPLIVGLDIAGVYRPCFDIGGDLYDFIEIDNHTVVVGIADVIGKGLPAAIMMSLFRGALRAYIDGYSGQHEMREIIGKLNETACRDCRDGEFVTLFLAKVDVKAMTVSYCNCGHEPAVLIRNGGTIDLEKGGLVLGLMPEAEYEIQTVQLEDGDCLVFYTDGLIDATNFDGQLWGKDRMIEIAKKSVVGSAERMAKNILRYRRRFVGLARQIDDTSIVVVKADRRAEPRFMESLEL